MTLCVQLYDVIILSETNQSRRQPTQDHNRRVPLILHDLSNALIFSEEWVCSKVSTLPRLVQRLSPAFGLSLRQAT